MSSNDILPIELDESRQVYSPGDHVRGIRCRSQPRTIPYGQLSQTRKMTAMRKGLCEHYLIGYPICVQQTPRDRYEYCRVCVDQATGEEAVDGCYDAPMLQMHLTRPLQSSLTMSRRFAPQLYARQAKPSAFQFLSAAHQNPTLCITPHVNRATMSMSANAMAALNLIGPP